MLSANLRLAGSPAQHLGAVSGEGWSHERESFSREAFPEHPHRRNEIGVAGHEERMIERIAVSAVKKVERDIHVGFLFLVTLRQPAAVWAPSILRFELPHNRNHATCGKCRYIGTVAPSRIREPFGVSGEVVDGRHTLRGAVHVPLHESAEIEPLEMGLSEPHDGMVQIETVDETDDPLDFHGGA